MAKPTSATFGDGIPVEDVASLTMAPPQMHREPASPAGGEHSGKTGANQRTRVPMQTTYGDTFPERVDAPADYRISPPEMHSHGPRGVEMDTNPGKGQEAKGEGGNVTYGDTAADAPFPTANVTTQNVPPGGVN